MRQSGRRRALGAIAVAASCIASFVAAELAIRALDGYRLTAVRLVRAVTPTAALAPRVQVANGVDPAWFATDGPPLTRLPTEPDIVNRYWSHRGVELASVYQWNLRYATNAVCGKDEPSHDLFKSFGPGERIFFFTPADGTPNPPYRYLPHVSYPSGLSTNNFGWRGPDLSFRKPRGVIRVAFVGASTTVAPHGYVFSYPDHLVYWLNLWARRTHRDVQFELINAGREGIASPSIAAVVREEVAPMDPDLVVYYEGSNQFWPADFIEWENGGAPPRLPTAPHRQSRVEQYLAIAIRVHSLVLRRRPDSDEPAKPLLRVRWPASLDERDPDLSSPKLPLNLPIILHDLDDIRVTLADRHQQLAVSSFVWMVYDGLRLDPVRNAGLYGYLNSTFWPFPYAHMRRMADVQNRVFEKYARVHGLPFIDVAARFPLDPDLFGDAVHMRPDGLRLHAWIALQQLVPIFAERLARGELPKNSVEHADHHPAFTGGARDTISLEELRRRCATVDISRGQ